jgi:hypothetical protein
MYKRKRSALEIGNNNHRWVGVTKKGKGNMNIRHGSMSTSIYIGLMLSGGSFKDNVERYHDSPFFNFKHTIVVQNTLAEGLAHERSLLSQA